MAIEVRKKNDVTILDISGKLTIGQGDVQLREKFQELLDAGGKKFVFNMLKVPYVDSAGLGETVACHKRVKERGGIIRLVMAPQSKSQAVFVLAALDRVFEIYPDVEKAEAAFS
jgi:anti-sigma B factor antagonist